VTTIEGIAASPGTCVAPAVLLASDQLTLPSGPVQQREPEISSLEEALEMVARQLEEGASESSGELAEVLEAQAMMARDPELFDAACKAIRDDGTPAPTAIIDAAETFAEALAASDSEYMAARAVDVRDVAKRIARRLLGVPEADLAQLRRPSVIVARDVSPADVARLDFDVVKGFVTEEGSRTSHTAIVARSFGVPAVVAAAGVVAAVDEGVVVGVDGDAGVVYVDPDEAVTGELVARSERRARAQQELASAAVADTRTSDGYEVELAVNVGSLKELETARQMGARAVGLLRTELVFFDRTEAPTKEEHTELLTGMASLLDGGRLVVRTFDFGADKPMPFLEVEGTSDSALGVRGIRLARAQPELLEAQLRAIATVAESGASIAVMAPMVATIEEVEWFADRARACGVVDAGAELGVMVEIPSAVFLADELAARLDFLSLGTNDLAQYLHAADRREGALASLQDPFAPALLRAVSAVCRAAAERAWVGVCGEAAADPSWALTALGLGVTELSMGAGSLADVHAAVGATTIEDCRTVAKRVLLAEDAAIARSTAGELLH
jgi:phosphoenolpyruvate-protein phosphotransferase (PTS system enzyme I)